MKIKKIIIDNFRCFEHLEVDFHERLTLFTAKNGQGKTAVLDAVKYLLGIMLGHLPQVSAPRMKSSDLREEWLPESELSGQQIWKSVNKAPFVRLTGVSDEDREWDTTLKRDSSPETVKQIPPAIGGKAIFESADKYIDAANSKQSPDFFFPVFGYYGADRAVVRGKPDLLGYLRKKVNRFNGYKNALEHGMNYKSLIEWMCYVERKQNREKNIVRDWDYQTIEQKTIQLALEKMLPGFHNLRVLPDTLDLMIDVEENGSFKTCCVDTQLSDGYKMVLVLILDIMSRILKLNSDIEMATPEKLLTVPGIILLDEIDLHLHPSWQQKILPDLLKTFPNIQFIATTHSPQAVSSVPSEYVRILEGGKLIPLDTQTQGVESQEILASVFGTDPAPQEDEWVGKLNEYGARTARGETDCGGLYEELAGHFGSEYPPLKRIEILRQLRDRRKD